MTLVELQRALRQLRCSGMAAGLEGRLLRLPSPSQAWWPVGDSPRPRSGDRSSQSAVARPGTLDWVP
jgi:hypothetical protein